MLQETGLNLKGLMERLSNQMDRKLTFEQIARITTKILRDDCELSNSVRYDGNGYFTITELRY